MRLKVPRSPLGSWSVLLLNLSALMVHLLLYSSRDNGDQPKRGDRGGECPPGQQQQQQQQQFQDLGDVWVDDWDG